jgi:hypothetical protein
LSRRRNLGPLLPPTRTHWSETPTPDTFDPNKWRPVSATSCASWAGRRLERTSEIRRSRRTTVIARRIGSDLDRPSRPNRSRSGQRARSMARRAGCARLGRGARMISTGSPRGQLNSGRRTLCAVINWGTAGREASAIELNAMWGKSAGVCGTAVPGRRSVWTRRHTAGHAAPPWHRPSAAGPTTGPPRHADPRSGC